MYTKFENNPSRGFWVIALTPLRAAGGGRQVAGGGRLRRKTITSPDPSDTGDIINSWPISYKLNNSHIALFVVEIFATGSFHWITCRHMFKKRLSNNCTHCAPFNKSLSKIQTAKVKEKRHSIHETGWHFNHKLKTCTLLCLLEIDITSEVPKTQDGVQSPNLIYKAYKGIL